MKEQMTPNKFFSMFNSGKFNDKLEDFMVSCAQRNIEHMERMEAHIQFNSDNKEKVKQAMQEYYNHKDVTKVKTQVL